MVDDSLITTVADDANDTSLDPVSLVQPHPSPSQGKGDVKQTVS